LGLGSDEYAVENGVLKLDAWVHGDTTEAGCLREYRPSDYVRDKSPVPYKEDAEFDMFDSFLKLVTRSGSDRKKLQQYAGYVIGSTDRMPHHKALFLAGPPASGKSTFISTVSELVPDSKRSAQDPQVMTERFRSVGLRDNWLNVSGDIPSQAIEDVGTFKTLTGEDEVEAEIKFVQERKNFTPSCKHIFSANQLPTPGPLDRAFWRRILIVPFPNTVPREAREDRYHQKLLENDASALLNWALEGYKELQEKDGFTADLTVGETRDLWHTWSTSVFRFAARATKRDMGASETQKTVYDAYTEFCEKEMEDDIIPDGKRSFGKQFCRLKHVSPVNSTAPPEYENIRLRSDYKETGTGPGSGTSIGGKSD